MTNQRQENNNDDKLTITEKNASDILSITFIIATCYINYQSIFQKENWHNIIINTSTAAPLFTMISTFTLAAKNHIINKILSTKENSIMFNSAQKLIKKFKDEGKDEGKVERDAEWIEWANNGKDPEKMPSKINPIQKPKSKDKT